MPQSTRSLAELFPEKIKALNNQSAIDLLLTFDWSEEELEATIAKLGEARERVKGLAPDDREGAVDIIITLMEFFRHLEYRARETSTAAAKLNQLLAREK